MPLILSNFILPSPCTIAWSSIDKASLNDPSAAFEINDKAYIEQNCWKRFDQFLVGTYEYNDQEIFNV